MNKRIILFIFLMMISSQTFALKIYRPQNDGDMNDIKCFLKILDENNEDVTYTCGRVFYAWVTQPKVFYPYKKKYYLLGGMVLHIYLKPGKYKITVYTPQAEQRDFNCENTDTWESNTFEYDTNNPLNVLFVSPVANENGFYSGGWHLDYHAPKYYKYTKPYRPDLN